MSPLVLVYGILFAPVALAGGVVAWAGASFLRDVWRSRHPAAEVRAWYAPSLADEAQRWLQQR